jgi:hypothetical protein
MASWFFERWLRGEVAQRTEAWYRLCNEAGPMFEAAMDQIAAVKRRAGRLVVMLWPLFDAR